MQSSLPFGWLAFTGRVSNPLDREERFQISFSSSFPALFLTQRRLAFDVTGGEAHEVEVYDALMELHHVHPDKPPLVGFAIIFDWRLVV
jgi:hypothetical protein